MTATTELAPEGARHCGNCPGRRETLRSSICCVHGALPWGLFPQGGYDMIRPTECKTKPRNKREAWNRIGGKK